MKITNKHNILTLIFYGFITIHAIIILFLSNYFGMKFGFLPIFLIIISFAPIVLISIYLNITIHNPLYQLIKYVKTSGQVENVQKMSKNQSVFKIYQYIKDQKKINHNATVFAAQIGDGNFDISLDNLGTNNELTDVLEAMRGKLKAIAVEEKTRNWSTQGLAKFDQIFRENLNTDIKVLSELIASTLSKYINANQCGIYIINNDDPEHQYIELKAAYAYEKKKLHTQKIEMEEGLVGQCIFDKDIVFITDVPQDYIKITSGIGSANPTCILVVPTMANGIAIGAIELASFTVFESYKIDFVKKVAENFAATYTSVTSNNKMSKLLRESNIITQELRVKENSLMQNEEELTASQENLNAKLVELLAESNLSKSILEAINKSHACIQFDMRGNILETNEMFLSVMGYKKEEIIGKNERIFLQQNESESERYKMLWQSLEAGQFNSGEFKRINRLMEEVWMDVTYNPILDLEDKPFKILMFANFTTLQKQQEHEYKNKFHAINQSIGFLQLNSDFKIKNSNSFFNDRITIKRKDLRKTSFLTLLKNKYNVDEDIEKLQVELEKGNNQKNVFTLIGIDNTPLKFEISFTIGKDTNEEHLSYYAVMSILNEHFSPSFNDN